MLSINQRFSKHCSYHLQDEYVVERVLEALYRAGCMWRVSFDGADYWSKGAGMNIIPPGRGM
jgi:hypothetical protein